LERNVLLAGVHVAVGSATLDRSSWERDLHDADVGEPVDEDGVRVDLVEASGRIRVSDAL
jgi:hypothetical protein